MYIKNAIAYAGEPVKPIKVLNVRPLDGYKLCIHFTDGEEKTFDFEPLLDLPCYQPLRDKAVFDRVYVEYGCTVWNDGDIDIAPERLYADGVSVHKNISAC